MLFFRALLAFLALPELGAFAAPPMSIWPQPLHVAFRASGLAVLVLGIVLLLWRVRGFYVAVFMVLLGWAIGFRSPLLGAYAVAVLVAFHLRVIFGEEPWLAKTRGEAWTQNVSEGPRWRGVPRPAPSRDRALG